MAENNEDDPFNFNDPLAEIANASSAERAANSVVNLAANTISAAANNQESNEDESLTNEELLNLANRSNLLTPINLPLLGDE